MSGQISSPKFSVALLASLVTWMIGGVSWAQPLRVESDYRFGAVTWMQRSAEYRLLTEQTYRYALYQLTVGVHDRNWSADELQVDSGDFRDKPPAIILDLDETVLDNSAYNARNILNSKSFTTESWNAWCKEAKADAIPGALDFVRGAAGLGVKVFYITNREDVVKQETIDNLIQLGFPADSDSVLTQNKKAGRGDDKLTRRAAVAETHRIVLLLGDSMGDLCDGMDVKDYQQRNTVAAEKTRFLGTRWIVLPNPAYGGWQRALPKGAASLETKLELPDSSEAKETDP